MFSDELAVRAQSPLAQLLIKLLALCILLRSLAGAVVCKAEAIPIVGCLDTVAVVVAAAATFLLATLPSLPATTATTRT